MLDKSGNFSPATRATTATASRLSIVVFILALILFSEGLGNRPFSTRGEGREALVTQDMISKSNFILPYDDVSEIPTKPPMLAWMSAFVLINVPGVTPEAAIRFPSALMGATALSGATYVVTLFFGAELAIIFALILGSSGEWSRSSSHARVDMCFSAFMTLGLLAIYQIFDATSSVVTRSFLKDRSLQVWWLIATISIACSVLAKGPAGIVFPWTIALGAFILASIYSEAKPNFRALFLPAVFSVVVSTLLAGTWYWLAYKQGGADFVEVHLYRENMGRFKDIEGAHVGHVKPFYFSFIYLILSWLPWSLFSPVVIAELWKRRSEFKRRENLMLLFSLVWLAVVLGVVTITQSKREVYLLPAFPAVALLFAYVLRGLNRNRSVTIWTYRVSAIVFGMLGVAALALSVLISIVNAPAEVTRFAGTRLKEKGLEMALDATQIWNQSYVPTLLAVFLGAALLVTMFVTWKREVRTSIYAISLSCALMILFTNHVVFPIVAETESPKEFMAKVNESIGKEADLFQFKTQLYAAAYYAKRSVPLLESPERLVADKGAYVLMRDSDLPEFQKLLPTAQIVMQSANYAGNGDGKLLLVKNGLDLTTPPVPNS